MSESPDLSLVVPIVNEEQSLRPLHQRLVEVLDSGEWTYEIIFINDGSSDGTPAILNELADGHRCVTVIHFRRNFGKAAALDAGFKASRGRTLITMDADLQDEPKEIPRFLAKLHEGYDLVSGWKQKRRDSIDKTLPSKLFNFVVRLSSGLKLHDMNCGFKAYRREAVEGLNFYGEMHRFIPVLVYWRGFRVGEIPIEHHARQFGRSKYGFPRLFKGFFDLLTVVLLTRFATRPLHLFGGLGLLFGVLGVLILSYLSILWFVGLGPIGTRPLLFLGLLLTMVSAQFVCSGLVAEMITRHEYEERPNYVIRSVYRSGDDSAADE